MPINFLQSCDVKENENILKLPYLTQNEVINRQENYGKCLLQTPKPQFIKFLGKELISFPYVILYSMDAVWVIRVIYDFF